MTIWLRLTGKKKQKETPDTIFSVCSKIFILRSYQHRTHITLIELKRDIFRICFNEKRTFFV